MQVNKNWAMASYGWPAQEGLRPRLCLELRDVVNAS